MTTTIDRRTDAYPSRVATQPQRLERLDPVLHGKPGRAAPLTAAQCEAYERDGYLLLPGFFAQDTLARFRDELARLRQDPATRNGETAITEPGSGEVRSIFRVHVLSPVLRALAAEPRLVRLAEFILGERVYIHQSRINYKPGFIGKEFYWHSDFETWHVEDGMPRMRAISMSLSLTDNDALNGPLLLVPGSHRHYVACVGATPAEHYKESLKKQEYGVPDPDSLRRLVEAGGIVAATGPAGTLTVFDCNAMHGSNGNITPFDRSNVFLVYNAVGNRLVEPFGGIAPRPNFIAEREQLAPL